MSRMVNYRAGRRVPVQTQMSSAGLQAATPLVAGSPNAGAAAQQLANALGVAVTGFERRINETAARNADLEAGAKALQRQEYADEQERLARNTRFWQEKQARLQKEQQDRQRDEMATDVAFDIRRRQANNELIPEEELKTYQREGLFTPAKVEEFLSGNLSIVRRQQEAEAAAREKAQQEKEKLLSGLAQTEALVALESMLEEGIPPSSELLMSLQASIGLSPEKSMEIYRRGRKIIADRETAEQKALEEAQQALKRQREEESRYWDSVTELLNIRVQQVSDKYAHLGIKDASTRQRRLEDLARADAFAGSPDAELMSVSPEYSEIYMREAARGDWNRLKNSMDVALSQMATDDMDIAEVDEYLRSTILEAAREVDDPAYRATLVSQAGDYARKRMDQYVARQMQLVETNGYSQLVQNTSAEYAEYGVVDYEGLNESLVAMFPSGDERHGKMFSILSDIAIQNGAPEIFDNLPPEWTKADGSRVPSIATLEEFAPKIRENRQRAQSVADGRKRDEARARAEQLESSKARLFMEYTDRLNRKDYLTRGELLAQYDAGVLDASEVRQYYSRSETMRIEEEIEAAVISEATLSNTPLYMFASELTGDQISKIVDGKVAALVREGISLPEAAARVYLKHGYVADQVAARMANAQPQYFEEFRQAAQLYNALPYNAREAFVTDAGKRLMYERYNVLIEGADYDPSDSESVLRAQQAAVDMIVNTDPEAVKANRSAKRPEAEKQFDKLARKDLKGSFFGDVKLDQVGNQGYVRQYFYNQMTEFMARDMDPRDAMKVVLRKFQGRHTLVKADDKFYAVPRVEGVPEDFGDAIQWGTESLQALTGLDKSEIPKGSHLTIGDDGRTVTVVGPDEMNLTGRSWDVSEFYSLWRATWEPFKHAKRQEESRKRVQRRLEQEEQVKRFMDSLTDNNPF